MICRKSYSAIISEKEYFLVNIIFVKTSYHRVYDDPGPARYLDYCCGVTVMTDDVNKENYL